MSFTPKFKGLDNTTTNFRPMYQIYLEAALQADALSDKAVNASLLAATDVQRQEAEDIAKASMKFSLKCQEAANMVITLQNDGALRAYCENFDKTFLNFLNNVETWEERLVIIQKGLPENA